MITWPYRLLPPRSIDDWRITAGVVNGGVSVGGNFQTANFGGGGLWYVSPSQIHLRTREQQLAWRAIQGLLHQGATPLIVRVAEPFAPRPAGVAPAEVMHDDDETFDDGTGYWSDVAVAHLAADAGMGETLLTIDAPELDLGAGHQFSLVHDIEGEHLYRILQVDGVAGGVWTVRTNPPLRGDVTAGMECRFDEPGCVMKAATADTMPMPLELRLSDGAVAFIEYLSD